MNESIWLDNIEIPEFPKLNYEAKTEVLIIGGGIAGILTAYYLKNKGIDCILVEKNRICHGVTAGTTAKITAQHGLIYADILKSDGKDKAEMYLKANLSALENYKRLCKDIDCDFELKDNYVYSQSDRSGLEKEIGALEKIGYKAELVDTPNLPLKTVGAVKFLNQAQFHPIKFIKEIVKDLKIFENTFVLEVDGKTVVTNCGKIKAENIVVATHFPFINTHGSYFLKLYQHRSYALALKGAQNLDGMYVSDSKTGLSFRNYNDLMIVIGGSHRTGKIGGSYNGIEQFARIHYPQSKIQYRWATQDCMSLDKKPYIGRYSKNTADMYVASGFNKWGITGAMVSAMILSDMISGKTNEFQEVFSPSRSILKPQLAVNGFEAVTNIFNPFGKRCPHMGCSLKWNKAERTWDCPCHGSRFTDDGKLLNNPANGNLKS